MNSSISSHSASTSPDVSQSSVRRALVLGGGGSAGNAWLIGVLAGLLEAGVDLTTADLTIGTSAGATVAAQLSGATPTRLLADILDAAPPQRPVGPGFERGRGSGPVVDHLERFKQIIAASTDVADMRRTMGALALESTAVADNSERWRAVVAARLTSTQWPERSVLITAVDARTGEPTVFDRFSGVALVDAVAASTSGGGSAYSIADGRYIDGGYRSNADNADLATGYERVLVLSPLSGRSLHPVEWGTHLAAQVAQLREAGSSVETVFPDDSAEQLFGANAMDPSHRQPAARAGFDQGRSLAGRLATFWL